MRLLLLAVCFSIASAAPSWAQKASPSAVAPQAPALTETPSLEAIAAARDLFEAAIIDTAILDVMFQHVARDMMPGVRADIMASELYRDARNEHRAAMLAFLDSLPGLLQEEFRAEIGAIGDRAAPRFAQRLSAEDMTAVAAYMRRPEIQAEWRDLAERYIDNDVDGDLPNFPDFTTRRDAFSQSPSARAFAMQRDALDQILREEMDRSTSHIVPRLQFVIAAGFCAALEDECPQNIRNLVGHT